MTTYQPGMFGHQETMGKTDVWLTPPYIIDAVGPFDLDPCAAIDQPWQTAATMFTVHDDGLMRDWHGNVWLNPPYNRDIIGTWMERLASHGEGMALVFARTETEWFFNTVWGRASGLLFIEGRLFFHYPDGRRAPHNAGAPSVLVSYGRQNRTRLAESGLQGAFLALPDANSVVVLLPDVSWKELVTQMAKDAGGAVELADLYVMIADHPKTATNENWKAKIRQKVQTDAFERVGRGVYRLKEAA